MQSLDAICLLHSEVAESSRQTSPARLTRVPPALLQHSIKWSNLEAMQQFQMTRPQQQTHLLIKMYEKEKKISKLEDQVDSEKESEPVPDVDLKKYL